MNDKELVKTLRKVLMRVRCEVNGGFTSVGSNGKFSGHAVFTMMGLPLVTPEEMDDLMELAGISPDHVVPRGTCADCRHARPDGKHRDWGMPCAGCSFPRATKFDPMRRGTKRTQGLYGRGESCQCRVCKKRNEIWAQLTNDQKRRRRQLKVKA